MLLTASHNAITTNLPTSQGFSIANLTKLFKTFSNIYSDPLGAVPRELICNAWDANPGGVCNIIMPSALCPFLTISDDGPGMDEEFMNTRYTEVGFSTKDGSNDEIGGFGWGRLAALAISDTYTVTTQGRVYILAKDEFGIPRISPAGETDEKGTHIRVPIAVEKRQSLIAKVQAFLKWSDPSRYRIVGASVEPVVTIVEGEHFRLCLDNKQYFGALMGPVFYGIDQHKLGPAPDGHLPVQIVPKFGIGELDLPPSRESVSYEPRTIEAIKAKFDLIRAELPPLLFKALTEMPAFERLEALADLWCVKPIHEKWMEATGKKDPKELDFRLHKWGSYIERSKERLTFPLSASLYTRSYRSQKLGTRPNFEDKLTFQRKPTKGTLFFWNDIPNRVHDRIKGLSGPVYVLHPSTAVTTAEQASKLLGVMVTNLSDLPAPPAKVKSKNPPRILDQKGYDFSGYFPEDAVWISTDEGPRHGPLPEQYFILSKAAQKYYLESTNERLVDWQQRQLDEVRADPGLAQFLAARQVTMPYYWRGFLEENPTRFPEVQEELATLNKDLAFDRAEMLHYIELQPVKPAKTPKLRKLMKSKKRLDAYLRGLNGASRDGDIELFL